MNIYNHESIKKLALVPEELGEFSTWCTQDDVIHFLESEINDEYMILYACLPHVFMHSVLLPVEALDNSKLDDLSNWSCNPYSSWGITASTKDAWIENPLANAGSETLTEGEQLVFARSFEGSISKKDYYEINQKMTHCLDVHYVNERNAWCALDEHGDIEDIIKVVFIDGLPKGELGKIICIRKAELAKYTGVQNQVLFRMFDFTRYKPGEFNGWHGERETFSLSDSDSLHGQLTKVAGVGSFFRGFQFVDVRISKNAIVKNIWGESEEQEETRYCSFIAQDWKNSIVAELSCNPENLSNYFVESDLPFEITPAFFKPEVLLKYKTDREKYTLEARSIYCRGSWGLKSFDINTAGQVHAYLIDLSRLPYEEQLHWKQFNEEPKAPISERAVKTDFEGNWYDEYDPLISLKHKINEMHSQQVSWWKLRDVNAPGKVHYPYTASRDEWAEEMLNLDQLIVEGLQEKWLRGKAKDLQLNPKHNLRALKLIELILVGSDFEEEHAREIMTPFHVLHNLRSVLKGHTVGSEAEKARREALQEFGSYRSHYAKLCTDLDESLRIISDVFEDVVSANA